ncbi:Uncharacterized protein OBRU01_01140 [Operophtera brumata]|uniref:Sphingomyelin phosphodiesterase C-terminal domain-containing protein n=1 Tax=Operophtera brumata TaxID=104452 RepID=A0A0L7LUE6_OPEBR|nr:Uncharacterized protein OBRU01_01140 [Operophtera brumata]
MQYLTRLLLIRRCVRESSSAPATRQWEWLDAVLDKASANKEMSSSAPATRQWEWLDAVLDKATANKEMVSDTVQRAGVQLGAGDTAVGVARCNRPVSWAFLAPSVSPHRDPAGSSNPGLRLYKFDTNTGKVLDYTQYYLDLATANRNVGAVEWSAEYNLTQYYSLHEVVKHDNTDSCDGACAHQHFCAITCVEHVAYRQCVEAAASALAAAGKASPLIAPLMTIVTLFLFVLVFI